MRRARTEPTNLIGYMKKYGELTFDEKEFNEVDNLVFSLLIYLDWLEFQVEGRTLAEAGALLLHKYDYKLVRKQGIPEGEAYRALEAAVKTRRFGEVILSGYVYLANEEMMFSAITFGLTENLKYVAFEGTDKMLSGWREDFELSYKFPIASQLAARDYLNNQVELRGKKVIIGGHSKGGNLALAGAMLMNPLKALAKIVKIYNNDGPGLKKKQLKSRKYRLVRLKYEHIIPDSSIVGVLLLSEHNIVVKSTKKGILGHAMSTWQIKNDQLLPAMQTATSARLERRVERWMLTHSDRERERAVTAVFGMLAQTGLTDVLSMLKLRNLLKVARGMAGVERESRDLIVDFLKSLVVERGQK